MTPDDLVIKLKGIRNHLLKAETAWDSKINPCHSSNISSAKNLVQYLELRKHDLSSIQDELFQAGLSVLDLEVSQILEAIERTIHNLEKISGAFSENFEMKPETGLDKRKDKSEELFGSSSNRRKVRIMVTLPSEAADDYNLIRSLVSVGMNVARINCAHDNPTAWRKMIEKVRKCEEEINKKVHVAMDLAGPKIRTGKIPQHHFVKKVRPTKDKMGEVVSPFQLFLMSSELHPTYPSIQVEQHLIECIKKGDTIRYIDPRSKRRKLKVLEVGAGFVKTEGTKTTYFQKGGKLFYEENEYSILNVPAEEPFLLLKAEDVLRLEKESVHPSGEKTSIPSVACTLSAAIDDAQLGEPVFFDDGKIEGVIDEKHQDHLIIKIIHAKIKGSKLKSNKGINFPKSNLSVSGLTEKDCEDLKFVCKYADIVNFSFVNKPEEVAQLLSEIKKEGQQDELGVILKIETAKAYKNLPQIILEGLKTEKLGIMVARGDLAVEVGWKKLGDVVREILYMCKAAHVPVVWATQVLEGLSKTGTPTRSEIIDAVISSNSSCIMLNKGPYILDTIKLLNDIIKSFEEHWENDYVVFKELTAVNLDG